MQGFRLLGVSLGLMLGAGDGFANDLYDVPEVTEHSSWKAYMKENRYTCPGPLHSLKEARTVTIGTRRYRHSGYKLELMKDQADKDDLVKIGILGAIKDFSPGTKRNVQESVAWFKKEKVEWIVLNGDIAKGEFDFEEIIDHLLKENLPLLVVLGNLDSKGSWARIYKSRYEKYPNLVNGVWIRQIVADDVEFWTLSGYHDQRFVHQDGGCLYEKADVDVLRKKVTPSGRAPVVLVAHGPPRGKGRRGIDRIHDKVNVGDPNINRVLERAGVRFGLFSHILEAGGGAVKSNMTTSVKPGVRSSELHLNAGSVSSDPWQLNTGKVSYGMSVVVTLKGGQASYEVKRFKALVEE